MDSQDSVVEQTVHSLGRIKQIGKEKDDLVQLLRSELTNKENVLSQTTDDLEIEKSARRGLQQELKKLKEVTPASTSTTNVQYSSSYVAVLFDASFKAFQFQPKYIKDREKGGKAVVQELLHRVEDYLTTIGIDSKTAIIQIRAYVGAVVPSEANSPQMGSALDPELRQFFGQFNRAHALAEIITFAKGITRVDEKVCGRLKLYIADPKCGHIILGVSHDSQYRKFLLDIGIDPDSYDRLTLLQGCNGGSTADTLSSQKTLVLKTVFALGSGDAPSPVVKPGSADLQFDRTVPSPAIAQQQANARPTTDKSVQIPDFQPRIFRIWNQSAGKLCDRVPNVSPYDRFIKYLRHAKLCRKFYLWGTCKGHIGGGGDLCHNHPPLNDHQSDCLLFLARARPCDTVSLGGECHEQQCFHRHDQHNTAHEGESLATARPERGSKRPMDDRLETSDPRRVRHHEPQSGR